MRDFGKNTQLGWTGGGTVIFLEFNIKCLVSLRNISSCIGLVAMPVMNIGTLVYEVQ